MLIEKVSTGTTTTVTLQATRLTTDISAEFSSTVIEYVAENPDEIIIDMANCEFIDSSGLGAIMSIKKHTKDACALKLCNVGPSVMDVLKLTHMNRILDVTEAERLPIAA